MARLLAFLHRHGAARVLVLVLAALFVWALVAGAIWAAAGLGWLGVLAALGLVAGVLAIFNAPTTKEVSVGSGLLFAALLAFAAYALSAPALLS